MLFAIHSQFIRKPCALHTRSVCNTFAVIRSCSHLLRSAVAVYTEKSSECRGFCIRFADAIQMLRTRNTTATSCNRAKTHSQYIRYIFVMFLILPQYFRCTFPIYSVYIRNSYCFCSHTIAKISHNLVNPLADDNECPNSE